MYLGSMIKAEELRIGNWEMGIGNGLCLNYHTYLNYLNYLIYPNYQAVTT